MEYRKTYGVTVGLDSLAPSQWDILREGGRRYEAGQSLAVMERHVCFINRWSAGWDAPQPSYERIIDHDKYRVSYIVDGERLLGLPATTRKRSIIETVDDIKNVNQLRDALTNVVRRGGPVARVFALSEWDILNAAHLRDEWGISGMSAEQALNVRDKIRMKESLQRSVRVRVPEFRACHTLQDVEAFIKLVSFPIVVKPRQLAASQDVHIIRSADAWRNIAKTLVFEDLECERYCDGDVFHVDGVVKGGKLVVCFPSRHIAPPVNFLHGDPLGGMSLDPSSDEFQVLARFATDVVHGLQLDNTMFHLTVRNAQHDIPKGRVASRRLTYYRQPLGCARPHTVYTPL